MDVFVLRHAIAEDAGPGQPDSERRLTDLGRERLRLVVQKAMRAGMAPAITLREGGCVPGLDSTTRRGFRMGPAGRAEAAWQ